MEGIVEFSMNFGFRICYELRMADSICVLIKKKLTLTICIQCPVSSVQCLMSKAHWAIMHVKLATHFYFIFFNFVFKRLKFELFFISDHENEHVGSWNLWTRQANAIVHYYGRMNRFQKCHHWPLAMGFIWVACIRDQTVK